MSNYEKMSRKTYVTWDDVDRYANMLAEYAKEHRAVGVYGIPRGGVVLAVLVSYRAGIPLLSAPCKGCVVVDDITATGAALRNWEGRYDCAAMYRCTESTVDVSCYLRNVEDEWMVFPWE